MNFFSLMRVIIVSGLASIVSIKSALRTNSAPFSLCNMTKRSPLRDFYLCLSTSFRISVTNFSSVKRSMELWKSLRLKFVFSSLAIASFSEATVCSLKKIPVFPPGRIPSPPLHMQQRELHRLGPQQG